jgi:hypothetical protein
MKWLIWKLRGYFVGYQRRSVTLYKYVSTEGRAVAQAVSRWLPTAAARVRVRAEHVRFLFDKAALGQGSPSTSVSSASHHSTKFSIIIITRGWHNRPLVAVVPNGPNWTPPPTIPT